MNAATLDEPPEAVLADDEHFGRNFIGGKWVFPAMPYDFEIRNPADSTVTAVVPLSSRFDVSAAVEAGRAALSGAWSRDADRARLLLTLVDGLQARSEQLAHLQSQETGLPLDDSLAAVTATVAIARSVLDRGTPPDGGPAGVTGHVLSWGLPFTEVLTSTLPALLAGHSVVVKPSLRAPLSAVAFARLATEAGLPAGTVNIVQGTGTDVGAELLSRRDLAALYVRGGQRTTGQARRASQRTGVPLHLVHGGGNLCVAGPGSAASVGAIADAVAAGVRLHSGPFSLPLLAVHQDVAEAVLPAVLARLAAASPGPLPTDPIRGRSLARVGALVQEGARILLGGQVPDDIAHRMGWRIPATVLMLGEPGSPSARREQELAPIGPVLGVLTWTSWAELGKGLRATRHADGTTVVWGASTPPAGILPGVVVSSPGTGTWPAGAALGPTWTGQAP